MRSKAIYSLVPVLLLALLLLLPRIDAFFSVSMARKALAEPLLLLLCGWVASRLGARCRSPALAPSALVTAAFLLLFWMIPRSIDLTQIRPGANALYVVSMAVAGFLFSGYFPLLSGVAKVASALYLSSMLVALGLLYAFQSTLLCSAFTLKDQHAFGWMLVALGLVAYLWAFTSMARWLVPGRQRHCRDDRAPMTLS